MRLRTLGAFELLDGPGEDANRALTGGKTLALVACLALAPGRRASRDVLLDLLWGDVEAERGRRTLRQTIWSIRQRFGESSLRSEDDDLVLDLPIETDAAEFARDAEAGRLESAWARYRGHFIPVFATPGGAHFEHWADLERNRLRTLWHTVGTSLAARYLADGQAERAAAVARRLRDDDPDRTEAWALLVSALLASRQPLQARLEAEAAAAMLAGAGTRADPRLAALLDRARRQPLEAEPDESVRPDPELVGRERAFAILLAAWQAAAGGRGATVLVRGAAGLGKSRLLRDFHARLSAIGATAVFVRARSGERDLPYAVAAGIAQAVGALPGARGVSPATAAALVDLAPALSSWFAKGPGAPGDPDELLRVRTLALAEMVEAVAEERPLAIVVDDLHWVDDSSRQVIASLAARLQERPVLLALSLRPMRGGWQAPAGAEQIDLPPLTVAQVEQLLASMAAGDPALLAELGRILHAASGGVPLLALAALDLALDQRRLHLSDGRWECPDLDALRLALGRGSVLDQLLQTLPAGSDRLLLALSLAGRPIEDRFLASVAEALGGAELAPVLEQRGLIVRLGDEWEVAHDRIAEAALATAPPEQRQAVARALGHALLEAAHHQPRLLRVAGQLLAAAGDDDVAEAFRHWLAAIRRRGHWRNPVVAAAEFLGEGATVVQAQGLARRVPWLARLRYGWPELAAALAAVVVLAVGAGLVAALRGVVAPPAARLSVVFPPSSRGFLFDSLATECQPGRTCGRHPFPILVDFRDARGRATARGPDSVVVRLVEASGGTLVGRTTVPVGGSSVDFSDLAVEGPGGFVVEVAAGGLPPVRSHRYWIGHPHGQGGELRLRSGTVAGQAVDSIRRTITVAPGTPLTGSVRFWSLTTMRDAAILMGAVPTWGDRRTNFIVLTALPPHGAVEFEVPLEDAIDSGRMLTAPLRPGRYRVVFLMRPETEMRFIASMTNWVMGAPVWDDGNDVVDWGEAVFQRLDGAGVADSVTVLMRPREQGDWRSPQVPVSVAGTTIEVVVR